MTQLRTKKQKVRPTYHYAFAAEPRASKVAPTSEAAIESLYQYDPKYTRSDLARTFLVTALMIAIEVGIYILI